MRHILTKIWQMLSQHSTSGQKVQNGVHLRAQMSLKKSFVSILQSNSYFSHNYEKKMSPSGGLEPPTFRLTVERASQLRHEGSVVHEAKNL